jgi:hypothetical protein
MEAHHNKSGDVRPGAGTAQQLAVVQQEREQQKAGSCSVPEDAEIEQEGLAAGAEQEEQEVGVPQLHTEKGEGKVGGRSIIR